MILAAESNRERKNCATNFNSDISKSSQNADAYNMAQYSDFNACPRAFSISSCHFHWCKTKASMIGWVIFFHGGCGASWQGTSILKFKI